MWTVAWKGHSIKELSEGIFAASSSQYRSHETYSGYMQTLCINKNVVQMMLSQLQNVTEDTHFPAVIYNSELFGWAKDLFTQNFLDSVFMKTEAGEYKT